jgi:diaminopimelate decarboxylase
MKTFTTNFLAVGEAERLVSRHGTPLYVYSQDTIETQAQTMLSVPAPYGLTVRYAMKANPHPEVLKALREQGIKIDASSGFEAAFAVSQGFAPSDVLLTSQQLARNLDDLIERGVLFNATSLRQLEEYGKLFPGTEVGVRLNPGIGSGHSARTNVGGVSSSFGIWHEYLPRVSSLAANHRLTISRLHTHIGSGTDPKTWREATELSLGLAQLLPDVRTLNLGGGFKVGRMDDETSADMKVVGKAIASQLKAFARKTGRELHLELEPGTFLVANAGMLIASIEDITDTGSEGYTFLKVDTGMNDIMRPTLYGAQHPMDIVPSNDDTQEYIVVGHNCESGDLLTPAPVDPEALAPRRLPKAEVGDLLLIGGAGAYCASMSAHGYNGFPSAKEILL